MLLDAHAHPAAGAAEEAGLGERALSADHVAFTDPGARLVLPALRPLGTARVRVPLALMCADPRRIPAAPEPSGLAVGLQELARAAGMFVSRPGHGCLEAVYVERFAGPGRLTAIAGEPAAAAGALGALVIECGELELASLLAGAPRFLASAEVLPLVLRGSL